MYIFLSIFFGLYGFLHYYFFLRLKKTIILSLGTEIFIIFLLLFLNFSPLSVRALERAEFFISGRIIAYIGYSWMAFIFLFFSSSVCLEILKKFRVFLYLNSFFVPLIVSITLVIYGFFHAKNIGVEKVTIETQKLKKGEVIKIVQITDLHLGIILKDNFLERVVKIIDDLRPDILVSTGDLVDGQVNDISHLTKYFDNLKPPLGKYAILGNHEFYVGLNNSLSFLNKSGFEILRNRSVKVRENLLLAGIDDDTVRHYESNNYIDELSILKDLDKRDFIVFLKHKPKVLDLSKDIFDLQLSGHTHKGQIFPFTLVVKAFFPAKSGLSKYDSPSKVSYLYNSRGIGTWGPPVRLLSQPEITIIEIIGK